MRADDNVGDMECGYDRALLLVVNMEERCELCKHFKRLKHNFKRGKGFENSYCCDVLFNLPEDDTEAWVQEVPPRGMCELFTRRDK